jgi:hypothetical protein
MIGMTLGTSGGIFRHFSDMVTTIRLIFKAQARMG